MHWGADWGPPGCLTMLIWGRSLSLTCKVMSLWGYYLWFMAGTGLWWLILLQGSSSRTPGSSTLYWQQEHKKMVHKVAYDSPFHYWEQKKWNPKWVWFMNFKNHISQIRHILKPLEPWNRKSLCQYIHMCVCLCVCVHVCAFVFVCVYAFLYNQIYEDQFSIITCNHPPPSWPLWPQLTDHRLHQKALFFKAITK